MAAGTTKFPAKQIDAVADALSDDGADEKKLKKAVDAGLEALCSVTTLALEQKKAASKKKPSAAPAPKIDEGDEDDNQEDEEDGEELDLENLRDHEPDELAEKLSSVSEKSANAPKAPRGQAPQAFTIPPWLVPILNDAIRRLLERLLGTGL